MAARDRATEHYLTDAEIRERHIADTEGQARLKQIQDDIKSGAAPDAGIEGEELRDFIRDVESRA